MIIAFSGLDGAGKSTQLHLLGERVIASGGKVRVLWGRGGYTPGFEAAKSLFNGVLPRGGGVKQSDKKKREKIIRNPIVERIWLLIATLDLLVFWGLYVRLLRLFGYHILCDRYVPDTYLDFRRNFPDSEFTSKPVWRIAMSLVPRPTVHFIFLVDPVVSCKRSETKNEPFPDDLETLQWRYEEYEVILRSNPSAFIRVDGEKEKTEIKHLVDSAIFPETA